MPIIFGLGNIGAEYDQTRHNIGFDIVDRLADELSLTFSPGNGPFYVTEGSFRSRKIVIVKPTTYMNRSGSAVTKAMVSFKTDLRDCMVCYDDINLPPGTIRFRESGSAGGHNGISDIIAKTGTRNFPRLRFGVGNDFPRGGQVDHVLGRFKEDELPDVEAGLEKAVEGLICFIREGIVHTMNRHN